MKFEYEKEDDVRECVAYIDSDGDLVFETGYISLRSEKPGIFEGCKWKPWDSVRRFYRGDKITIEF